MHHYSNFSGICRGRMQKRTSEMEFSADFTSIHVVSNIFFEDFEPNVLFSISMSDLRDKMVRSLQKRPYK